MSLLLDRFLKWLGGVSKVRLAIGGAACVVLLLVFFQWQCGTSGLERKLEQKENEAIEQQPVERQAERRAEVKEKEATELDSEAKQKVKKAREAQNVNTTNSSYEEANRARCAAYPRDSECK